MQRDIYIIGIRYSSFRLVKAKCVKIFNSIFVMLSSHSASISRWTSWAKLNRCNRNWKIQKFEHWRIELFVEYFFGIFWTGSEAAKFEVVLKSWVFELKKSEFKMSEFEIVFAEPTFLRKFEMTKNENSWKIFSKQTKDHLMWKKTKIVKNSEKKTELHIFLNGLAHEMMKSKLKMIEFEQQNQQKNFSQFEFEKQWY